MMGQVNTWFQQWFPVKILPETNQLNLFCGYFVGKLVDERPDPLINAKGQRRGGSRRLQ